MFSSEILGCVVDGNYLTCAGQARCTTMILVQVMVCLFIHRYRLSDFNAIFLHKHYAK